MNDPLRGIRGRQPRSNGEPVIEVPISRTVIFQGVKVNVSPTPGGKQLQIIDPAGSTLYVLDLEPEIARALAGKLVGGIDLSAQMPEEGKAA